MSSPLMPKALLPDQAYRIPPDILAWLYNHKGWWFNVSDKGVVTAHDENSPHLGAQPNPWRPEIFAELVEACKARDLDPDTITGNQRYWKALEAAELALPTPPKEKA